MTEQMHSCEQLAEGIVKLSRNLLLVNYRFLNRAISMLPMVHAQKISLAMDGTALYYNSRFVLHRFRQEPSGVTRDLLHMILHGVFRHFMVDPTIDRDCWNLACDIAVEHLINEMHSPMLHARRTDRQGAMIALLQKDLSVMNAEQIYHWLQEKDFSSQELMEQREVFLADGHGLWYGETSSDAKGNKDIHQQKVWEDISHRMQTELETMEKDESSALVQSLRRLNRTKQDYTEFLQRFGVYSETMHLSAEEFDQNFYTYGLELYGNIPLIEPLEYSEQKRIRDLVIAIDTSGSVKGELVQSFVRHTYSILHSITSSSEQLNLYILQCDDRIREAVHIRTQEEFEEYIQQMEIRGLGRTDFRPVFAYVDQRRENGELSHLQGLLYFTDGDGIFPTEPPGYDTAFILPSEDLDEDAIPRWALHIVLTKEDMSHDRI